MAACSPTREAKAALISLPAIGPNLGDNREIYSLSKNVAAGREGPNSSAIRDLLILMWSGNTCSHPICRAAASLGPGDRQRTDSTLSQHLFWSRGIERYASAIGADRLSRPGSCGRSIATISLPPFSPGSNIGTPVLSATMVSATRWLARISRARRSVSARSTK